jgi:SAM-dependent methyltransferase
VADERIIPGDSRFANELAVHYSRYRFAAQFVAGKRVLDAACGVGYGSRLLADSGASLVTGVDISSQALSLANQRYGCHRVRFIQDDLCSLNKVDGPFDLAVSFESIEHVHDAPGFLSRVAELLAPGGILLISTPNALVTGNVDAKPDNPFHLREYTIEQFTSVLSRCFQIQELWGQRFSAAYEGLRRASFILWNSPALRAERLFQRVLRRPVSPNAIAGTIATEADVVISSLNVESASVLIAKCSRRD